ncbi:MAG: glycosyltransferase [Candidatus Cloacimonetes bacterium]|nr:glycosyltransferase [Candidatus Cloacimonadota bacterium]
MCETINIIIPAYNEGENIINVLKQIYNTVKYDFEIFIVYDNDNDTTLKPVKKFSKNNEKIHLVKNMFGNGALNAVKTGFAKVEHGVTLLVMADSSDEISLINRMYEVINGGYDVVCGSRYMKGGKQIGGNIIKKLLSRLAGNSLHYIIKIPTHDISNSFKMYRTEIIKLLNIESKEGFEVIVELIIKSYLSGYKIIELPTIWTDRSKGDSRFKMFKWMKHYIHWYIYSIFNYLFKKKSASI